MLNGGMAWCHKVQNIMTIKCSWNGQQAKHSRNTIDNFSSFTISKPEKNVQNKIHEKDDQIQNN